MIIGNNNFKDQKPNFTSNFDERFQTIVNENKNNNNNNSNFNENINNYSDVNNKNDMTNKSFAMLQERYNNGLISIEEFTKKCNQLNKQRQK